jgi:hypothetical protein
MSRRDSEGRDLTDLPGLWDESDRHDAPDAIVIDGECFVIADVAANPRAILGLYADRCRDLDYEYAGRVAAEDACEMWYEVVTYHADHAADCARVIGPGDRACTCGYSRRLSEALQRYDALAKPPTLYARLVALGHAALAYARYRGRAAGAALRQPYIDALAACEAAE